MTNTLKIKSFLSTIDKEEAFDLVNYLFIVHVFEKFAFGKNFTKWIRTILANQESCIINEGKTTTYFKLI